MQSFLEVDYVIIGSIDVEQDEYAPEEQDLDLKK